MASSSTGWSYDSPSSEAYAQAGGEIPALLGEKDLRYNDASSPPKNQQQTQERKIIYDATVYLKFKEKDMEGISDSVVTIAKKYSGYMLRSSNRSVTIRVPSENLKTAISDLEALSKHSEHSVNGNDVTDRFADLELRLNNAQKTQVRYIALLDKAEKVSEIVEIEKELERLNREIESYKGQLKRLNELEAFSTITVRIDKRVRPGVIGYVFVGLWKGIKYLFVRD